ncbi:hypothetical protein N657DRAFT_650392 [Parathielavia appendiculata]|uniref:Uncharacterized protein n=1 Tax=Parathielavia appendiculata TaxID=2587402 RepID=A0AAN6YZF8_9PEZI|nr:hypothetical protein N657DRAFT_650392 [Parathielavia appendiculata]
MSARKESTAGVGPDGKSDEEDNRNDEDDEDDEPYFANTSRVLFGTNDLLASSPAAVPDSLPPAVEIGNTSGGGGLGAPIGPQPLFKRTLLCFDDVVGSGRIWTPINLRGDADPHWREVPHNPAHPVGSQPSPFYANSDGVCWRAGGMSRLQT